MMASFSRTVLALALVLGLQPPAPAAERLDADRIRQIAGWLPADPAGFGPPIDDRAFWDSAATRRLFADAVPSAGRLLKQPLPPQPDSLFLEFSRTGNRSRWQEVAASRRQRVAAFALAECLENKGRFLKPLEEAIAAVCAEKTWVLPAHDRSLDNFNGKAIVPDLGATGLAAELAEADHLLGARLAPETRRLAAGNIRRRVLAPFRDMAEGRQREAWWLRAPMNWNAVCVASTVFAALTLEPSREDRAWYAAAGERFIAHSLKGFTPDGYCAEGVGYWNYGFGHNILMTETLRRATGGRIDLLDDPAAVPPALFCLRAEVLPGMYPGIADCSPGTRPAPDLRGYVVRRLGITNVAASTEPASKNLVFNLLFADGGRTLPRIRGAVDYSPDPLRSYFPSGGVLIARDAPSRPPFAAVFKGGHNDEPHNHNDLGSFSVIVGTNVLVCDPGGEVYTARTFSARRYDSRVLSSYGHAVPVLGGRLQRTGRQAQAVILAADFTPEADTFKLDLRSAYDLKGLEKFERTFTFRRGPRPSLEIRDEVRFSSPQEYEGALITWGSVTRTDDSGIRISAGGDAVRVAVETGGIPFRIREETLDEDVRTPRRPVRVGLALDRRTSAVTVTLRIAPSVD